MKTKLVVLFVTLLALGSNLFAQGQQGIPSNPLGGNITAASSNCSVVQSCVWMRLPSNGSTATVTLAGTFVQTDLIELSGDGGNTWATNATLSAGGITSVSVNGFSDIRVRGSAFTSGSAAVTINVGILQVQSVVAGGSSSSSPGTVNPGVASTLCPGCTAKFDGKVCQAPNITITNGLNTVTCAVAIYTAADNGKDCFATNHNPATDNDYTSSVTIMARGSFTFSSATTGTCTVATASSDASHGWFIVGTNDDAAWAASEAASFAGPQCLPVTVPGGYSLVRSSHFVTAPTTCTNAQTGTFRGMQVTGQGKFSSTLVIEPDYNFASDVSGHMFFSMNGMTVKDLSIMGGGQSNITAPSGTIGIYIGLDAQALNVQLTGFGGGTNNITGMVIDDAGVWNMIIDGFGGLCLDIKTGYFNGTAAFAGNCVGNNSNGRIMSCSGGGVQPTYPQCYVQGAGFQNSTSATFTSAMISVASGAQLFFDNSQVICINGQASQGFSIQGFAKITNSFLDCSATATQALAGVTGSGTMEVCNSIVKGGSASLAINVSNTAQFLSCGGNHIGTNTSGPLQTASTGSIILSPSDVLLNGTTWYNAGGVALTCSANCGTSPAISGRNESMVLTLGSATPAASTFTVTFAGAWASAPSCQATRATTGTTPVSAGVVTTTTTAVVNLSANMVASEKYNIVCQPGI